MNRIYESNLRIFGLTIGNRGQHAIFSYNGLFNCTHFNRTHHLYLAFFQNFYVMTIADESDEVKHVFEKI